MSGFSGANADSLELAGRELGSSAGSVERIRGSLRAQLYTSHWNGPSADRYRQAWDSIHSPALADAEAFLRACGDRLAENAREQRAASEGRIGTIGGAWFGFGLGLGWTRSDLDPNDITGLLFDLLDIADGLFSFINPAVGFGIGIGLGLIDLFGDDGGYGGDYKWVERAMDILGIAAAGVGLGALIVAGVTGAAVSVPVVGGAMIAGGIIKGVDMFLRTSAGSAFMGWSADTARSAWRATAGGLRSAWSQARSIGEAGRSAIIGSARRAMDATFGVGRRVVQAGNEVVDAAMSVIDNGAKIGGGLLAGARRLVSL